MIFPLRSSVKNMYSRCVALLFFATCFTVINAQTVDFSASDSSGCGTVTPIFTDLSTSVGDPIISWEWDFGDNTPHSFVQNPSHIYTAVGCYDIRLKITTNSGDTAALIKPNFICVNPYPIITAPTVNPPIGCAPATFNLTGNTSPGSSPIVTWFWEIGAGNIFQGQDITVSIPIPGTQNVVIQVFDDNNCAADTTFPNLLTVVPSPEADFTSNVTSACQPPLNVNFFNTSTLNSGAMPPGSTYEWFFPGGLPATATGQSPTNINFGNSGTFDVTLIVTTPAGCKDTVVKSGYIGVGAVIAGIDVPNPVCVGKTVVFQGTGASNFTWDLDCNGTTDGTGTSISHTYNTTGTFCIGVLASNGAGCSNSTTVNITVEPSPLADFTVDKNIDCKVVSSNFTFDASASLGGTPGTLTYSWDFGAGASLPAPYVTTNPITQVNYTSVGNKTVRLIVENAAGCKDTLRRTNYISIQIPTANFVADITEGCRPLNITFTSSSTSNDTIVDYNWIVTPPGGIVPTPGSLPALTPNPTLTFNNTGNYDVMLIITTQGGCVDTFERTQYLAIGTHPQMGFNYDLSSVCVNNQIQFTSLFTNPNWQYAWDFDYNPPAFNPGASNPDPTWAYGDTGVFSVALIINNNGCRDTLVQDDIITVNGPKADFDATPSVFCGLPATFSFSNNSQNGAVGVTNYQWYFNNSATPFSSANVPPATIPFNPPTQNYNGSPAQIPVKLVVTNGATGCTDSLTRNVVVGNPVANFFLADLTICRNVATTFFAQSQNGTSFIWDYGDGVIDTTNGDGQHAYTQNGSYTVTLVVMDASECTDTITFFDYVTVTGPFADFVASDTTGCTPFTTDFTNLTQLYPGTTQSSITWSFPGAPPTPVTGINNPTHTFTQNGSYTVILSVTDSDGCVGVRTRSDYIIATFPDVRFTADDTVTCVGNQITFTPTIPGSSYQWFFGDQTSATSQGAGSVQHAYSAPGFYTVKVIVTDANGCIDSATKVNYIEIEGMTPDFTGAPTSAPCPPLTSLFNDLSVGNIAGWTWNFGDGSPNSTLQNPGHIYTYAGNFDVTLIITHEDGCQDTMIKNDFIVLNGPIGNVTVSPTQACPYDSVSFTIITDRTQNIFYEAQPGDVRFLTTSTLGPDTIVIKYAYTVPGIYTPIFQIQDAQGCIYTIPNISNVTVYRPPLAQFNIDPMAGCTPLVVSFDNNSLPGPGQPPVGGALVNAWVWGFGDGTFSTVQNPPPKTYNTPNAYNVTLTVTDTHGCKDTALQIVQAYLQPVPEFGASATVGCAPQGILFSDLTSVTVPTFWQWDFGDGGTSNVQDPVHTYTADGTYTVSLIIEDANGCRDTLTKDQYIHLRHPLASFVADTTLGCEPFEACFNASASLSDTLIDTYLWNFGGGAPVISNLDSACHTYSNAGVYSVYLQITDIIGCTDDTTITNYITVNETVIPQPIDILRATVQNPGLVRVDYLPYPLPDFRQYILYRFIPGMNTWLRVDSTNNQNTTTLSDAIGIDCEEFSYCYRVLVQNECLKYSRMSETERHCTVGLNAIKQQDAVKLLWSHYEGWGNATNNNVLQYNIYRADSPTYNLAAMDSIAAVGGIFNTYIDSQTFCRDSAYYRVVAVEFGGNQQTSLSDVSGNSPQHNTPIQRSHVTYATVIADKDIEVMWGDYPGYKPMNYILERSKGGYVWKQLAVLPLGQLSYLDTEVMVDSMSYNYRVIVLDSCGDLTNPGRTGKTILLKAEMDDEQNPVLTWSKYVEWVANVEYYEIQVFDEQNDWTRVDVVGQDDTKFIDYKTKLNQANLCYRIVAHELGGREAISVSNEDCVTLNPTIYAPNAFTPNNDGNNDVFFIKGTNVTEFELKIYDRWGKEIFLSKNMNDGWDGSVKGQSAVEGVYMYRVKGRGEKGESFNMKGSITLIR